MGTPTANQTRTRDLEADLWIWGRSRSQLSHRRRWDFPKAPGSNELLGRFPESGCFKPLRVGILWAWQTNQQGLPRPTHFSACLRLEKPGRQHGTCSPWSQKKGGGGKSPRRALFAQKDEPPSFSPAEVVGEVGQCPVQALTKPSNNSATPGKKQGESVRPVQWLSIWLRLLFIFPCWF